MYAIPAASRDRWKLSNKSTIGTTDPQLDLSTTIVSFLRISELNALRGSAWSKVEIVVGKIVIVSDVTNVGTIIDKLGAALRIIINCVNLREYVWAGTGCSKVVRGKSSNKVESDLLSVVFDNVRTTAVKNIVAIRYASLSMGIFQPWFLGFRRFLYIPQPRQCMLCAPSRWLRRGGYRQGWWHQEASRRLGIPHWL